MYLIDREHPPRHIHIEYGEHQAVMELVNPNVIEGSLPKRCRQSMREWAEFHQEESIEMWDTQASPRGETLLPWANFDIPSLIDRSTRHVGRPT